MSIHKPSSTMTDADIDHDLDRLERLVHQAASVPLWRISSALSKLPEIIELSMTLTKVVIHRVRTLERDQ